MTLDFSTPNMVVVAYPPWAGGKLLINALGLSTSGCLQHSVLARLQLDNNLSTKKKLNFLLGKLETSQYYWDDLGLGCIQLFGPQLDNSTIVTDLIAKDIKFFKVAHNLKNLISILNTWQKAPVVCFKNSSNVVNYRRDVVPTHVLVHEDAMTNFLKQSGSSQTIVWDCDWFFDKKTFANQVKMLYNKLSLTDFNAEYVEELQSAYFRAWDVNKQYLKYQS